MSQNIVIQGASPSSRDGAIKWQLCHVNILDHSMLNWLDKNAYEKRPSNLNYSACSISSIHVCLILVKGLSVIIIKSR